MSDATCRPCDAAIDKAKKMICKVIREELRADCERVLESILRGKASPELFWTLPLSPEEREEVMKRLKSAAEVVG